MRFLRVFPLLVLGSALLGAFQAPYPIGNGVSAPVAIYKPEPAYTPEAKDARIEGAVWLAIVIDENGVPSEVAVKQSLEPSLDQRAVETIRNWRFTPGKKDGVPVAVQATISIQFKLL